MDIDFYTKSEINEKFSVTETEDTGRDFYTKTEIQAKVGTPETIVIDGFDLDFYTKTEIDSIPTVDFMPHMDNVTNYYDCTKDVTIGGYWLSQVDCYGTRYDMPLGGNISLAADGSVTMTGDSNGYAWFTTKTTDPRTRTVYLVAKTDHDTTQSQNPMLFGCISLYSGSGAFNIATYRGGNDVILYDSFGSPFINSGATALDYHVITLVRDGSEYRMYIDGDFKGSCTNDNTYFTNSQDGTHVFGVGCLHSQNGYYNWGDKVRKYFKFVAVADAVHTAAQIAENAAWLRSHFELD